MKKLTALLMALCLLAGCAPGEPTPTSAPTATPTPTATATPMPQPTPALHLWEGTAEQQTLLTGFEAGTPLSYLTTGQSSGVTAVVLFRGEDGNGCNLAFQQDGGSWYPVGFAAELVNGTPQWEPDPSTLTLVDASTVAVEITESSTRRVLRQTVSCVWSGSDTSFTNASEVLQEAQLEYELYTGQVPHIFTHCLIAYPELKDGSGKMRYDADCINVTEFKNLLNELYANGYSLVDIYDIYEKDENGNLHMKEAVEVPVGRKPVVISIDDVVYDYDKRGNGMVDLLALDENNNLVSGTYLKDGSIDWSYDREVFPILEQFIAQHPDFSSHGARVTLAMTGFAGVFGYRTEDSDRPGDRQAEVEKATAVADRLKELGYSFASHSYGHYSHDKHSVSSLRSDLQAFRDEVVPIIGDVSVYVYPYGKLITPGDPRYAVMQEYGFDLFCSVSHFFFSRNYDSGDTLYMTRVAIDGYSLRNYHGVLSPLFDTEKVIDHANRP